MKQIALAVGLGFLVLAFAVWPAHRAWADDETENVGIKLEAPLDAVNCAAAPPVISVLGLMIDISQAQIEVHGEDVEDESEDAPITCADLTLGQTVEVKLASDVVDPVTGLLAATEVEVGGQGVKIQAPLQAVDPNAPSVTVLGLVVDIRSATNENDDSQGDEEGEAPVDPTKLMVGQTVELELVSSTPPLVATSLEVKNADNEVELHLIDNDMNDDMNEDDAGEVDVDVMEKVAVTAPGSNKHVKKVMEMHMTGSGNTIRLSGLPTGKAKITVTRGNKKGHKSVKVKANQMRIVKMHIK